jgi:hypothetical protein
MSSENVVENFPTISGFSAVTPMGSWYNARPVKRCRVKICRGKEFENIAYLAKNVCQGKNLTQNGALLVWVR